MMHPLDFRELAKERHALPPPLGDDLVRTAMQKFATEVAG